MKEDILEEKEEKSISKDYSSDEILMKPFLLGWKREVVNRIITKNGTPQCDIYYFTPNGKKIRSLTEIKSNLTDGLTPDCFLFKREPMGLPSNYETVRDARMRGKGDEKGPKPKPNRSLKTLNKPKPKNEKITDETENAEKTQPEKKLEIHGEKTEEENMEVNAEEKKKEEDVKEPKKAKQNNNDEKENKKVVNKKNVDTKLGTRLRTQSVSKRKEVLKNIMRGKQLKQAKVVAGKKILKKVVQKQSPKKSLLKSKSKKQTAIKSKKKSSVNLESVPKSVKNNQVKSKSNSTKDTASSSDKNKNSIADDLKSIVQKNIGKYREMREKQKLGGIKTQPRQQSRKVVVSRKRSEPISKNTKFYLKPLEKGWRRELVFRMNSASSGQQADVYYFHPSGKKLRSSREVAENLTHGLSLECFTFRKEPLGCGEPSEVIRNARTPNK